MERQQVVNRVVLRRSAKGIAVDTEYLERFTTEHEAEVGAAERVITEVGLEPGRGDLLVAYLDERGELPTDHPRTAKTGKPSAAKDNLAALHHPLADAHRKVAEMTKVTGYLTKVSDMVAVTGRVHPQVGVLGASATGRFSVKEPELQQFPADARPILVADEGREWTSIDWSSIEPVVMANCAGDLGFLAPFEAGGDLYAPLVQAAGVDRKTAKVVLLAAMYGQGRAKLAATLDTDIDTATRIQTDVFSAMPATKRFMDKIRGLGDQQGVIITGAGRVLPIPRDPQTRQCFGYKDVNYFCQGTAGDLMYDAIAGLHDAGLDDAFYLTMHDELVVDSEAAEDVRRIMEQPPEWLCTWAGRTPVIRTDTNPLGSHWPYV